MRVRRKRDWTSDLPGAVVIGGDYQGLGIVRSLGRRGVPICVVDDECSISGFSRYASVSVQVSDLRERNRVVETLLELGHHLALNSWVLFPTRDELVAAISQDRSALSKLYRVPTPSWSTVRHACDKRNTYCLAKELNIPIPETWFPQNAADVSAIMSGYPLSIKPAIKEHFFYATKQKAWLAGNRSELEQLYERATKVAGTGGVIVQDLIPGDGRNQFAYCSFFKDGRAVGSMVARRRRQHPHQFGRASTFVETVEMPELEKLSERFLRAINYYGLVEMEYKLDPRDAQFKLLDVNARTWGYHSLGSSAGVDFPYIVYRDQIGQPVDPCRAATGVSWVRLLTDLPTSLIDISRGRLTFKEAARSLCNCDTEAVFSREDPIPGLVECVLFPYLIVKKGF